MFWTTTEGNADIVKCVGFKTLNEEVATTVEDRKAMSEHY